MGRLQGLMFWMTWLIAIDESGDTGSGSRFFMMAAIIVSHRRQLLPAIKAIPSGPKEFKFYNSLPERIEPVLCAFSGCCVDIVYVVADKHDYRSEYYGLYGNVLYSSVLWTQRMTWKCRQFRPSFTPPPHPFGNDKGRCRPLGVGVS